MSKKERQKIQKNVKTNEARACLTWWRLRNAKQEVDFGVGAPRPETARSSRKSKGNPSQRVLEGGRMKVVMDLDFGQSYGRLPTKLRARADVSI